MKSLVRRTSALLGLVALLLAPLRAWAVTESFCSFANVASFTMNGSAAQALGKEIRLTTNTANEAGSAFLTTPIAFPAGTQLHTYFQFQIGPNLAGAEGLAFVLQNSPSKASALGGTGAAIGYGATVKPSVVVEFDTHLDAGDPNANHVGLMVGDDPTTHLASGVPSFGTMANSGPINAWVDYDGMTLQVFVSLNMTKGTAVISKAVNLAGILGGGTIYAGFTASTGVAPIAPNQHDLLAWELSTDGVTCTCQGGDALCAAVNMATPACGANVCVQCTGTNHAACKAPTAVCNAATDLCVGCNVNGDCMAPTGLCNAASHVCQSCSNNAQCAVFPATPVCDLAGANQGACVQCASDGDCQLLAGTPRCDVANQCVQCVSNADCGGNKPLCDANGACTGCAKDADCSGTPLTPACQVSGACAQCSATNVSQCGGMTKVCNVGDGSCVGCELNTDCSGATPICDVLNVCQACTLDAQCTGNPAGGACATTGLKAGQCVVCTKNADCGGGSPTCDITSNQCVGCNKDSDCVAPDGKCNVAAHACVQCLTGADCASPGKPVCSNVPATANTCVPCQDNYSMPPLQNSCPSPALSACQPPNFPAGGDGGTTPNPLAGTCTQCSVIDSMPCVATMATPLCITASAVCGCVKDMDCHAGLYCDASQLMTGVCKTGCRVINGESNCGGAGDSYCSKQDGTIGTCVTQPCTTNAQCKAPTPVCDTQVQPQTCVECLVATDCPDAKLGVCDVITHACVACTASPPETAACDPQGAGPICLGNDTCGCMLDADCGAPDSGRVCNAAKHTCEAGCRGTGGNRCPFDMTCTSTTAKEGQCKTPAGTTGTSGQGGGIPASTSSVGGAGGAPGSRIIASVGSGCAVATEGAGPGRLGLLAALAALAVSRRRKRRT